MNKKIKGILIPIDVMKNPNLSLTAKFLYGFILCLLEDEGYCCVTNNQFAQILKISPITVSNLIQKLVKEKYLTKELGWENKKVRYLYPINLSEEVKKELERKQKE